MLYDHYFQKIYDFVFYKIGNKNDTQDLVSDVFMKVFENIGSFDIARGTKFSSWIYMIANNVVIDHFR
ncbi:MAG: RNA polymerase sigma factor [Patescibacteria group bacterium]